MEEYIENRKLTKSDIPLIHFLDDYNILIWRDLVYLDCDEDFFKEFIKKYTITSVCSSEYATEWKLRLLIDDYENRKSYNIPWTEITNCNAKLSEDFIQKYIDNLYLPSIISNQILSEEFIENNWEYFKDNLNIIAKYQTHLSPEFFEKNMSSIKPCIFSELLKIIQFPFRFFEDHFNEFEPIVLGTAIRFQDCLKDIIGLEFKHEFVRFKEPITTKENEEEIITEEENK